MNSDPRVLRKRLAELKVTRAPEPWMQMPVIAVGGLAAIGYSSDSAALLVLSIGGGRSLYDTQSGARVGRDHNLDMQTWLSRDGLTARGIADYESEQFRVSGLWGGGLPTIGGEWSCDVVAPDWPIEVVVLQPRWCDVRVEQFAHGCVAVADSTAFDVRAAGFSWDGSTFVVATTADVTMWRRPTC